jgi:sigma-B regulation protein RsbQ
MFAHGFGCSQAVWRYVAPAFTENYQVITFDYVGAGGSDLTAYDPVKYNSLSGYADVLDIITELDLRDVVYVGHSVSSMIGVLAANREPSRFGALVLVGPSPRYINDGDYVGGFEAVDIEALLDSLHSNYLGWSSTMAPVMMGNPDEPKLGAELASSFCSINPRIASQFAKVTFLSDNREDLHSVVVPTLVIQSSEDVIAPFQVGAYVHDQIPNSRLVVLTSTGHVPNLSDPEQLSAKILAYLR